MQINDLQRFVSNSGGTSNHPRRARAKLTTSVQQSAPPIVAHTDIASISSSPCRLVRIILGSGTPAKCSSRLSLAFSLIVAHSDPSLQNLSLHDRPGLRDHCLTTERVRCDRPA